MKYCAKCGNAMADDMLYCQKCGAKFAQGNLLQEQLDKLKQYNLVIDASTVNWEYLRADIKRTGDLIAKQDSLREEVEDLVNQILETLKANPDNIIEREVYVFILTMGYKMCLESKKIFENISGFKELFDQGTDLCRRGLISPQKCLNDMINTDHLYKCFAGLQGVNAARLKGKLDSRVIADNIEYQDLTKQLAQAHSDSFKACVNRHINFFYAPGTDFLNLNWDYFRMIVDGLPQELIDNIDLSGWDLALDYLARNNNARFGEEFRHKRDLERQERIKAERKREDDKFWSSHPELLEKKQQIDIMLSSITEKYNEEEQLLSKANTQVNSLHNQIQDNQRKLATNQERVVKLEKKLFRKQKAQDEIALILEENYKIRTEITSFQRQVRDAEKEFKLIRMQVETSKKELDNLKNELAFLRNR